MIVNDTPQDFRVFKTVTIGRSVTPPGTVTLAIIPNGKRCDSIKTRTFQSTLPSTPFLLHQEVIMPSFISWVPTPNDDISAFFDLAPVTAHDVVFDLGSGDGRLLFAALENGAGRVVGLELNKEKCEEAKEAACQRGVGDRTLFINEDVLDANLTEATVVVCYLCTTASAALKPKFARELAPGSRVVMESFPVPGWKPNQTIDLGYKRFYLYVMPPEIGEQGGDGPVMDLTDYEL